MANALALAGVPTEISANVRGALWLKLILNCAYNALSAISQLPYGEVVKGEGVAEVPCRQDPSEVGTLSGRVSPLSRPYPPHYRAAFAFSGILYPLRHLLPCGRNTVASQ